jgi:DNA-binding transcriptional MerR regulator
MRPQVDARLRVVLVGGTTAPAEMTVDELADAVGVPVRTLRSFRSSGLLDPPTMRGRIGYYHHHHVVQVHLVQMLQDRGFPQRLLAQMLRTDAGRVALCRVLEWLAPDESPFQRLRMAVDSAELDALRATAPAAFETLDRLGLIESSAGHEHVAALTLVAAGALLSREVDAAALVTATAAAATLATTCVDAAVALCPDESAESAQSAAAYLGIVATDALAIRLRSRLADRAADGLPDRGDQLDLDGSIQG